jgi:cyclophilin family peptidyl-prolyl cis-trans isomerase
MKTKRACVAGVACLLAAGVLSGCGFEWPDAFYYGERPLRPAPQPARQPVRPPQETATDRPTEPAATIRGDYPIVVMETSEGTIRIELWPDRAPQTVANFLEYVDEGFYDGTVFHRVIDGFMIQGGGLTPDLREKPTRAPIKNEASADVPNQTGTIAMARTGAVDSATSQFFINIANNAFLDHRDDTTRGFGYAVFGRVIEGMHVLDRIRSVPTGRSGQYEDVPLTPVIIKSIRRAMRP